jgi:hypothetical protein
MSRVRHECVKSASKVRQKCVKSVSEGCSSRYLMASGGRVSRLSQESEWSE